MSALAAKPAPEYMLEARGLAHRYGAVSALRGVDLAIAPGEVVALVGPSGCGKTTMLRLCAGVEELQQGHLSIAGQLVAEPGRALPPERRGVGFVFQDYALFPHLKVIENVGFGLDHVGAAERRQRGLAALEQVGMAAHAQKYPHQLSGGQQQRVALARALAPQPRIVLLDEPFSGLDAQLRGQVRDDTLHVLKRAGTATLLVTHDAEEAMFMADRIAVMRDGLVQQMGTPVDIYYKPANAYVAAFFSDVNRIGGIVRGGAVATPFGPIPAPGLADGLAVEAIIRPEALRLAAIEAADATMPTARVVAARMLGRASLVHLEAEGGGPERPPLHLHSRVPGLFLPREGERVAVSLDRQQAFIFPKESEP
ncbi:ABC transporter ATP-binding protein [Oceanibaculum pacificum]|uniref:ABC transporter n=1 Tax=Oceanibaculum pacificum TaxID=580166 RepID=A0A154VC45_9PROT|nr:ABC transporter ATP-binding protein [Oceanibaculum pacificum]KZC98839.1 ABC transporter [Oceanibaculum pacificum]